MNVAASFESCIRAGLDARTTSDFVSAIREFETACQLRPNALGARCELAFTHLQSGDLEQAWRLFQVVIEQDTSNVSALAGLASLCRQQGRPVEGVTYARRAIEADPSRNALKLELADLLREGSEVDEASALYEYVLLQDSKCERALIGLAKACRSQGHFARSADLVRAALANNPSLAITAREFAKSLGSVSLTDSQAILEDINLRFPEDTNTLDELTRTNAAKGASEEAIRRLNQLVTCLPEDRNHRFRFATALRESSRFEEADQQYAEILAREPNHSMAMIGRGLVSRSTGDLNLSLQFFKQAVLSDPASIGVRAELAHALLQVGQFEESSRIFETLCAEATGAGAGAAWQGLGQVELARGNYSRAISLVEKAVAVEPSNLDRQVFLAGLNRENGRLEVAQNILTGCLETDASNPRVWHEHGMQKRAVHDHPGALQAFLRASKCKPGYGDVEAAREYRALGDPGSAQVVYRQVPAQSSDALLARLGLAELDLSSGDLLSCLSGCDAIIRDFPRHLGTYRLKALALIQLDRSVEAIATVDALPASGPLVASADSVRLEIYRTCGEKDRAEHLLSQPRVLQSESFELRFETVLTNLTFGNQTEAKCALHALSAKRPFERSRALFAKGLLADEEWHTDAAIGHFRSATKLYPDDPGAHQHLARLYLLSCDEKKVTEHLRATLELNQASIKLRRESANVSQSLLGQLLNELRLDSRLSRELRDLGRKTAIARVEPLMNLVRSNRQLTPAAIALMLALRQTGVFDAGRSPRSQNVEVVQIPRKIMQFWDQRRPPESICRFLRTWVENHPGVAYARLRQCHCA